MFYVVLAAIFALILLILFLPFKVELVYNEKGRFMKFVLAGIPIYKLTTKKKKKTSQTTPQEKVKKLEKNSRKLGEKIKSFSDLFKTAVKLIKRYVPADIVDVNISVGTGDAPSTAVATGALWATVCTFLGILGTVIPIKKRNVKITPRFNELAFSFEGKCIFKTRIVHIIVIAITILVKIKSRKGKED